MPSLLSTILFVFFLSVCRNHVRITMELIRHILIAVDQFLLKISANAFHPVLRHHHDVIINDIRQLIISIKSVHKIYALHDFSFFLCIWVFCFLFMVYVYKERLDQEKKTENIETQTSV